MLERAMVGDKDEVEINVFDQIEEALEEREGSDRRKSDGKKDDDESDRRRGDRRKDIVE